jgi:hypothetical protein
MDHMTHDRAGCLICKWSAVSIYIYIYIYIYVISLAHLCLLSVVASVCQVNHQCLAKLEKAESECKGLMEKYSIVENDKKSLKQVRSLDLD